MALSDKPRVVVVGLGSIGRRHTRLLLERNDLKVEVVEINRQAFEIAEKELGKLKSHESFETALKAQPDFIWLCTPTQFHAAQTVSALESNIHVFCEKPMSDSLENALKMKAAADQSGRVLNIGYMLHFLPAMIRLRELIQSQTLGNILHIHARVGTYITLVNSLSRYQSHQVGSLFLDYSHQPDIFYWLTGQIPKTVTISGFQAGEIELSSNPNVAIIVCEYETPLVSTLHLNYVQMPQRHDYEIIGDKGWASLDFETGEIKIGLRAEQKTMTENHKYERDDLYRAQIAAFLDAVNGKRPAETSAAAGIVSTAVCEAAVTSFQTGKRISVEIP